MAEKKLTKIENYEIIKSILGDNPQYAEQIAFCDHEIELLVKKASRPRGETKAQKENAKIREELFAVLTEEPTIFAEVMAKSGLSQSKCSSLLRQLCEEDRATKTIVKGKSYYSIKE